MPNGTYGGVRGKETKVGQKTFVSRPTRSTLGIALTSGLDELPACRVPLLDLHGGKPRLLGGDFLFAPMCEMKLRKNEIKLRKNEMKLRKKEITSPNYCSFPPLENKLSAVGKLKSS